MDYTLAGNTQIIEVVPAPLPVGYALPASDGFSDWYANWRYPRLLPDTVFYGSRLPAGPDVRWFRRCAYAAANSRRVHRWPRPDSDTALDLAWDQTRESSWASLAHPSSRLPRRDQHTSFRHDAALRPRDPGLLPGQAAHSALFFLILRVRTGHPPFRLLPAAAVRRQYSPEPGGADGRNHALPDRNLRQIRQRPTLRRQTIISRGVVHQSQQRRDLGRLQPRLRASLLLPGIQDRLQRTTVRLPQHIAHALDVHPNLLGNIVGRPSRRRQCNDPSPTMGHCLSRTLRFRNGLLFCFCQSSYIEWHSTLICHISEYQYPSRKKALGTLWFKKLRFIL